MRFIHISDTHFLVKNHPEIYGIDYNPNDILEQFLNSHDFSTYDFLIHTGDIISDGCRQDYDQFFSVMDEHLPIGFPRYYILGNHDNRDEYFASLNKKINQSRNYYLGYKDGYRLIFLDTLTEGCHEGSIDDEQLHWMYKELANPYENGTLIFMHHPLEIGWYSNSDEFIMPPDLKERLNNSDVIAIFTGHIHMQRTSIISSIPQFTANSLAFGISLRKNTFWRNNRLGYSIVEISKNHIDYQHEILLPKVTDFKKEVRETFENKI